MLMGEEALGGIAVYSQSPRQWSEDEIRLLSLLANQTAIAIENTRLFEAEHTARKRAEVLHMQTIQQAQDLALAYDTTIEGWSRALDLRDKETEEHTRRVTNLTCNCASVRNKRCRIKTYTARRITPRYWENGHPRYYSPQNRGIK
jgi:GAF domain-containing protein